MSAIKNKYVIYLFFIVFIFLFNFVYNVIKHWTLIFFPEERIVCTGRTGCCGR